MDIFENPLEVISIASLLLLMLLNSHRALTLASTVVVEEEIIKDVATTSFMMDRNVLQEDAISRVVLQHFCLWNAYALLEEDLGFWVKPRSTTWFSRFLLNEYDDERWVQMFRMSKQSVMSLSTLLAPAIRRRDTNYRLAVPVTVRVACTMFKLCHGASLLIYSEMFAVRRSTVSIILREVVHAINVALRNEISWPPVEAVQSIAAGFQQLCGLPGVVGAIEGTHFAISKPQFGASDYYYFKSGGYTMHCQAVVDSSKRFLDICVGMPGSTNDSRVLRKSTLYHRGQRRTLWDSQFTFNGFNPYLLGDSGYPLLPLLMVPHRNHSRLAIADQLFNRRHSRGRVVVENAFGILKLAFRELHVKTELHVTFIPDVVMCCAILHNILLNESHEHVERLLEVLQNEAANQNLNVNEPSAPVAAEVPDDVEGALEGASTRRDLGIFLNLQRFGAT